MPIAGEWEGQNRNNRIPSRRNPNIPRGTETWGDWGQSKKRTQQQRDRYRRNSRARSRALAGSGKSASGYSRGFGGRGQGGMQRPTSGLAGGRRQSFGRSGGGRVIDKYSRWGGPNQRPDGKQTLPTFRPVEQGRRWDAGSSGGSFMAGGQNARRGLDQANSRRRAQRRRNQAGPQRGPVQTLDGRGRRMSGGWNIRDRRRARGRRNTGRIVPRRGGGFISQYGGGGANRGRVIPGRRRYNV